MSSAINVSPKRLVVYLLSFAALAAAILILHKHTQAITISMILEAVATTPLSKIILCLLATFISFCALSAHEIIAVKTAVPKRVAPQIPILAGTIGNALGNTLGFHAVTITAWRYRLYSRTGMGAMDIARISGIALMGTALGFSGTAAIALLTDKKPMELVHGNSISQVMGLILLFVIGIAFWASRKHRQIKLGRFTVSLPAESVLAKQLIIGLIEMSAAIYASYILLPANLSPGFAHFAVFYIAVTLFGIVSHAPGGIGVFEAGMMAALTTKGRADILAALPLYRLIYNLLPFFIACGAAALYEWQRISSTKDSV